MAKPRQTKNTERQKYSSKASHPGQQCRRGEPIFYSEKKKPISLTLTPTAIEKLTQMAIELSVSRSEVIEQLLREITQTEVKEILERDSKNRQ